MFKPLSIGAALIGMPLLARAEPALTIYNQNFAVVRDTVPLNLQTGLNQVRYDGATSQVEPSSVTLRDPKSEHGLQIVEQNYQTDVLTESYLLSLYEGKTINFRMATPEGVKTVAGKILRSGYVPASLQGDFSDSYLHYVIEGESVGFQYVQRAASQTPLIEVNGQLQFSLPGEPMFPALPSDAILQPSLSWKLRSEAPVKLDAELAYITGGMSWLATYNLVAPSGAEASNPQIQALEMNGLVSVTNQSGKTFENAALKLMAGDINKVPDFTTPFFQRQLNSLNISESGFPRPVTEKTFNDYHLYTVDQHATLRDGETKQIEFLKSPRVLAHTSYLYDGAVYDATRWKSYGYDSIRRDDSLGTSYTQKVAVSLDFQNDPSNGLGLPLPKGKIRLYRRDAVGQLQFIGENEIDHTPQGETVSVTTGNAFDLVGARLRTQYLQDQSKRCADESFKITVRNHKTVPAEVRILEHLYRGENWTIAAKSNLFLQRDSNTIEFRVQIPPDDEKVVSYTVHYTW